MEINVNNSWSGLLLHGVFTHGSRIEIELSVGLPANELYYIEAAFRIANELLRGRSKNLFGSIDNG